MRYCVTPESLISVRTLCVTIIGTESGLIGLGATVSVWRAHESIMPINSSVSNMWRDVFIEAVVIDVEK